MESILAKKQLQKIIFWGIFINYFICNFFQLLYLILHSKKVATYSKEQNKKRIMTIG